MADFLAFVECAGCGEMFPVRKKMALNRAKWCSEKCRKGTLYVRHCVDCGTRISSDNGNGPRAATRCRSCANTETARRRYAGRRALIEALWAQGKSGREIAEAMGWKGRSALSKCRRRGYDLPYRRSPEAVAKMKVTGSRNLVKARAARHPRVAA